MVSSYRSEYTFILASSVTSVCPTESGSLHIVAFDSSLCHVGYLAYISLGAAMIFRDSACHPVIIYVGSLLRLTNRNMCTRPDI